MNQQANKPRGTFKRVCMWLGGVGLLAAVAGGLAYGPEVYGLLRVSQEVDKIASENDRVNGKWPRASDACSYCHGFDGNTPNQSYARLAGQPAEYLRNQLKAFAAGERSDPTMTPFALSLSPQELDGVVAHFSKMTPQPNKTVQVDAASVARGEALAKANNCAACHGAQLQGNGSFPRLAGQGRDYIVSQLSRFKSGERKDPAGVMNAMVRALSSKDFEDLAQFASSR